MGIQNYQLTRNNIGNARENKSERNIWRISWQTPEEQKGFVTTLASKVDGLSDSKGRSLGLEFLFISVYDRCQSTMLSVKYLWGRRELMFWAELYLCSKQLEFLAFSREGGSLQKNFTLPYEQELKNVQWGIRWCSWVKHMKSHLQLFNQPWIKTRKLKANGSFYINKRGRT